MGSHEWVPISVPFPRHFPSPLPKRQDLSEFRNGKVSLPYVMLAPIYPSSVVTSAKLSLTWVNVLPFLYAPTSSSPALQKDFFHYVLSPC